MEIDSPYLAKPGKKLDLKSIPTSDTGRFKSKEAGLAAAGKNLEKMATYQERLYAEAKRSLLIVLQAMDTGGKDGTIEFVFSSIDPQGCAVTSFKAPTVTELSHDYLWRVHQCTPARGMFGIFNRSHYEDVLVPPIKGWIDRDLTKKRYEHINAFEKMLVDEGTTILKFYLHISKDEQKERLIARQKDPAKQWKFNPSDLDARQDWDKYMKSYEEIFDKCNTSVAPWYIVPADRKWYRNYVVSEIIAKALEQMDPKFPKVAIDPKQYVVE
jgi:PPK2 family polyphosphate:nucleotide phosphotransferase